MASKNKVTFTMTRRSTTPVLRTDHSGYDLKASYDIRVEGEPDVIARAVRTVVGEPCNGDNHWAVDIYDNGGPDTVPTIPDNSTEEQARRILFRFLGADYEFAGLGGTMTRAEERKYRNALNNALSATRRLVDALPKGCDFKTSYRPVNAHTGLLYHCIELAKVEGDSEYEQELRDECSAVVMEWL
jgi:hypothetical protein